MIFVCDHSQGMAGGNLDIAKAAIEQFVNVYMKQGFSHPLMLLTCGGSSEEPACITRCSLGDPVGLFEKEVKMMDTTMPGVGGGEGVNFSQPISHALSLLSKYRLRDNMDTFGYGRHLNNLAPANIFVFTDRDTPMAPFRLGKDEGYMHDFISHPYRWDQHVYLFVIGKKKPKADASGGVDAGLVELIRGTGGDVLNVSSLKEAQRTMKTLLDGMVSSGPTVSLKLSALDAAGNNSLGVFPALGKVVTGGGTPDAFIPEDNLVEGGMEALPQRSSVPTFKLFSALPPALHGERGSPRLSSPQECKKLLKELKMPNDCMECMLKGSGAVLPTDGDGGLYYVGTSPSESQGGGGSTMFGLLQASPTNKVSSNGSGKMTLELRIFPPNFHLLAGVLKTGLALVSGGVGGGGFQSGQALHAQFRQEFEQYVSSIPGYCLKPMMVLLNRYGLAKVVQSNNPRLQEQMQYKLHSRPYNRLQKWARQARDELADIEKQQRDRLPRIPPLDPGALALASSAQARQQLPIGPYSGSMPKTLVDVPQQHLLSIWEAMRRAIFGGSDAAMLQGLSVPGVLGSSGCRVPANFAKQRVQVDGNGKSGWDWMQDAVGATQIARLQARDMSDYMYVLARDEGLRDALELREAVPAEKEKDKDGTAVNSSKSAVAEEDTESGILKRKLSAVNFGSRFSKRGKQDTAIVDIDGFEGINSMTASITTTTTTSSSSTESTKTQAMTDEIASTNANSSEGGLYGDTPYPYDSEDDSALTTTSVASTPSASSSISVQGSISAVNYGTNYGAPAAPAAAPSRKRQREEGNSGVATAATPVTTAAPMPAEEEWRKEWSKSNQRHYWFNVRTKHSVWHDPTVGR